MLQLEYTPYIWPFVVSLAVTIFLGIYAIRRPHFIAATTFASTMFALSVWTLCYTIELSSARLGGKIFWATMKYIGSAPGPVIWFVLSVQLTKNDKWLNRPLRIFLWSFAVVTVFVVFTNDLHHWFWTDVQMVPGQPETQSKHGFYFSVYAAVMYLLIITSVLLYFNYYRTTPALFRRQALLMALAGFTPLAGRMFKHVLGIDIFPKVDEVILFFLFSGMLFGLAIFKYGALNIVPIAHDLIIQNINAGIIVLDRIKRVVELNPYARELVGFDHSQAIGNPLSEVLADWPDIEIDAGLEKEIVVRRGDEQTDLYVQTSQIKEAGGDLAGYTLVLFDITARKNAERQLKILARTDSLTGVTNRRHFFELARAEYARAERYRRSVVIMMFDLDHFKEVNDRYGHLFGDQVLKIVAAECRRHLRATDIFARFGGEEFICLFSEGSLEDARYTAERIRRVIEEFRLKCEQEIVHITMSIGLAYKRAEDDLTLNELIHQADQALYESKANGRNQVTVWS